MSAEDLEKGPSPFVKYSTEEGKSEYGMIVNHRIFGEPPVRHEKVLTLDKDVIDIRFEDLETVDQDDLGELAQTLIDNYPVALQNAKRNTVREIEKDKSN